MEIAWEGKYPVVCTPNFNKKQLLSRKFCFAY